MSPGGAVMVRLADYRRQRGIRQRDVAQALGVSQTFMSKIEHGRADCQVGTVVRYGSAVGVSRLHLAALIVDALEGR